MHMRRAVAACTSPEVFFGAAGRADAGAQAGAMSTDALGLAMDALALGDGALP